jgi:O-antigen ligase
VVAVRPGLDRWSGTALISIKGHSSINPGSLLAVFLVAVGSAYLLENWSVVRRAPSIRAFGALLALAVISIPLSSARTVGIEEILRLAAIVVLYGIAYVCVKRTRDLSLLAAALICSGLAPACVAIYQASHSQLSLHHGFPRVRGSLATFDALGILMALVIVFAIPLAVSRAGRLRLLSWIALPVLMAALVASYGRTGWIGATVGLLIVGAVRQKWLIVAVPVLMVAVAVAVPSTTSRVLELSGSQHNTFTSRVHQWTEALPSVGHRPVIGQGFGTLSSRSTKSLLSDYVRTLVELGIPGLLVYLWLLLSAAVGVYRGAVLAHYSGDRTAAAICLGAAAVVPVYALMSADSNLLTQIVIAGTAWTMIACGHAMAQHDWHEMRRVS